MQYSLDEIRRHNLLSPWLCATTCPPNECQKRQCRAIWENQVVVIETIPGDDDTLIRDDRYLGLIGSFGRPPAQVIQSLQE